MSNDFVVSALKYRPKEFSDVVGQKSVTDTLINAIEKKRLAHALLFTGPRGVGKTTCARILAKYINSSEGDNESRDLDFNVFELDAASNNSVDDIRALIEQIHFYPQKGKYKVYIIDEVHMLSQAAFNAFLKTLEEPPSHVIFILATTEKNKVIPTILSRCQIFDFNRISTRDIKEHLSGIASKENISADDDALHLIAQKSDGSLRDSLSIFDRIVNYCDGKITLKSICDNLNILDYNYYFRIVDIFLDGSISNSLLHYNTILNNGFDGHNFIIGLSEHFRNLLVGKDPSTVDLLDVGKSLKKQYVEYAKSVKTADVITSLQLLSECEYKYKTTENKRLLVEITLIKLTSLFSKKSIDKSPRTKESIKASPIESVEKDNSPNRPNEIIAQETKSTDLEKKKIEISRSDKIKSDRADRASAPSGGWSSMSIKYFKERDDLTEEKPPSVDKPFQNDDLKLAWREYSNILHRENKSLSLQILMKEMPTLKNSNEIHFCVPSNSARIEFEEKKEEILKFLSKKLSNHSISLKLEIKPKKEKDNPNKVYKLQEKLDYMINKNPEFKKMKDKLDLELG
ncbi:DNA polymerase III subunit gamma/tau [Ichthyobacterium seriolicida]|uniref:DNA polymerase III subunit gamma/tau n=1 Tax=Ichthyobacterium seriolicida TaxID=242600 RepID=A0A1J1EB48_9FLAO|nr:DNA polymerase III subunit gamma/tau [Ichthyobacterium seriolicida]BAV95163.1 DNA polymerase III subunits gamma/tau [Ichthyobacterium seriolicida]